MRGGRRSGAGRRRVSLRLKDLRGTRRRDREARVPEHVPLGPMEAPADLTADERRYFGVVAGMLELQKRASPHYVPIVTLLARRLAQVEMLSAVLAIVGVTYRPRRGPASPIRARPEVRMRADAMRHAQSLLKDLMLSPAAALAVAAAAAPGANPFAEF